MDDEEVLPTELVPLQSPAAHPLLDPSDKPVVLGASFDFDTPTGKVRLSKALRAKDISLDIAAGHVFHVVDMVVYVGTFPLRDTGELQRMTAVRLILDDGSTLGWNSDIASHQFRDAIVGVAGMPPYHPPLAIKVVRMASKNHPGGSWYTFELAGPQKEVSQNDPD